MRSRCIRDKSSTGDMAGDLCQHQGLCVLEADYLSCKHPGPGSWSAKCRFQHERKPLPTKHCHNSQIMSGCHTWLLTAWLSVQSSCALQGNQAAAQPLLVYAECRYLLTSCVMPRGPYGIMEETRAGALSGLPAIQLSASAIKVRLWQKSHVKHVAGAGKHVAATGWVYQARRRSRKHL